MNRNVSKKTIDFVIWLLIVVDLRLSIWNWCSSELIQKKKVWIRITFAFDIFIKLKSHFYRKTYYFSIYLHWIDELNLHVDLDHRIVHNIAAQILYQFLHIVDLMPLCLINFTSTWLYRRIFFKIRFLISTIRISFCFKTNKREFWYIFFCDLIQAKLDNSPPKC